MALSIGAGAAKIDVNCVAFSSSSHGYEHGHCEFVAFGGTATTVGTAASATTFKDKGPRLQVHKLSLFGRAPKSPKSVANAPLLFTIHTVLQPSPLTVSSWPWLGARAW